MLDLDIQATSEHELKPDTSHLDLHHCLPGDPERAGSGEQQGCCQCPPQSQVLLVGTVIFLGLSSGP